VKYVIDIDGTICSPKGIGGYAESIPFKSRIARINELYDAGNYIVYWTARGMDSGVDYTELTHKQLAEWGAKFDELKMHKPSYDIWIDDKAFNADDWFNE
jgi:histidinol phosphatase-like enzyme